MTRLGAQRGRQRGVRLLERLARRTKHPVDLETGAVVSVTAQYADVGDTKTNVVCDLAGGYR